MGIRNFFGPKVFIARHSEKKKFIHFYAVYVRRRGDVVMKECTVLDNPFFFFGDPLGDILKVACPLRLACGAD